jgi:hypothetical protein
MSRTTHCTSHCSQCGRHFHSLTSFDTHQIHDQDGWPICLDPLDLEDRHGKARLVALARNGICDMYAEIQRDVTVWTMAGYEKAGETFRKASEGSDGSAGGQESRIGEDAS